VLALILSGTLCVIFIFLSSPKAVPGLVMDVPFTSELDYKDTYQKGFPFNCWRIFENEDLNTFENQLMIPEFIVNYFIFFLAVSGCMLLNYVFAKRGQTKLTT